MKARQRLEAHISELFHKDDVALPAEHAHRKSEAVLGSIGREDLLSRRLEGGCRHPVRQFGTMLGETLVCVGSEQAVEAAAARKLSERTAQYCRAGRGWGTG